MHSRKLVRPQCAQSAWGSLATHVWKHMISSSVAVGHILARSVYQAYIRRKPISRANSKMDSHAHVRHTTRVYLVVHVVQLAAACKNPEADIECQQYFVDGKQETKIIADS